jgi:DNA-binding transcriptional LysR family regulator
VVVAAGESIIQWLLLPRLPHIRKTLPETELKILNLPTSQVVDRLVDGTVDFGIVRKTAVTKPLIGKSLGSFRYALFVPEALCLERKASESSRLLMNLPLATLEGEGAFRKALDRQARKEELTLRIELECASFPLVARAVQTEALAAILPTLAAGELRGAKAREFRLDILSALEREMCIAWNPRLLRIRPALEPIKTKMAKMLVF